MSKSFNITLTDEAAEILQYSVASERKKGEWLSDLVLKSQQPQGDGLLERIEGRLARIERQLSALVAERRLTDSQN